jgi:hypothetical protein
MPDILDVGAVQRRSRGDAAGACRRGYMIQRGDRSLDDDPTTSR